MIPFNILPALRVGRNSVILIMSLWGLTCPVVGSEIFIGGGYGFQPGTKENNQSYFIDINAYDRVRSEKQMLSIGGSVTHIKQNEQTLHAISLYPELKLFTHVLDKKSYFHVRALGPTWLSSKSLGEREQAMQFAFQAQVGFGMYLDPSESLQVRFLYRHFSNANLKQPNDGIDVPFNLALGWRF